MNKNYFTCPRCGTNLDYDPTPAPWQTFPAPQDIKTEAERIRAERDEIPEGHHIVGYIKHSPMEAAQIGAEYSPVVEPIPASGTSRDNATLKRDLLDAYAAATEKNKEMDALKHIMECADTPLMADVLKERDALKAEVERLNQRINNQLDAGYRLDDARCDAVARAEKAEAELAAARPLADACEGLLAFIREKFPKDFEPGGKGYLCPHHKAIDAALNAYRAGRDK